MILILIASLILADAGKWVNSHRLMIIRFDLFLAVGCKMSHTAALSSVRAVGIDIWSSGGCSNRNNPSCTSLEQINCNAVNCIKIFKQNSGCPVTITGGSIHLLCECFLKNFSLL